MIVLLFVAAACAADAYTTDHLIKRGGREKVSAWLMGAHPSRHTVWATLFGLPVLAIGVALYAVPAVWPVALPVVALRGYFAVRNHGAAR